MHCPMCVGSVRLSDDIPAHDGGLALVGEPALPGDLIEAALPQPHNLSRNDLRELLELAPITFLERRGCHHVSLRVLVASSNLSNPALTGPPRRQLRDMRARSPSPFVPCPTPAGPVRGRRRAGESARRPSRPPPRGRARARSGRYR